MLRFMLSVSNALRLAGDAAHVASMVMLVQKIRKTRSISGLSYKTQLLKWIVFVARYLDIFNIDFMEPFSIYNAIMKFAYIGFQSVLLYTIRFKYFHTYEPELDNFKSEMLVLPGIILAFLVNISEGSFKFSQLMYNFSVLLESVAIVPQLVQLQKMQESETITTRYIFLLGIYRVFYLHNWIIKKINGLYVNDLLLAMGILQTILYIHFFVLFYGYVFHNRGLKRIPK